MQVQIYLNGIADPITCNCTITLNQLSISSNSNGHDGVLSTNYNSLNISAIKTPYYF
ncbi:hypothetical protein J6P52_01375 [bacterium]|nr:hypothetical protein [bacterium]MBO6095343.1 hypothetical protein [bacterium]